MIYAGCSISQDHTECAIPVSSISCVTAPPNSDVLLIITHTLEAANIVQTCGGLLVRISQISQLKRGQLICRHYIIALWVTNVYPFHWYDRICCLECAFINLVFPATF